MIPKEAMAMKILSHDVNDITIPVWRWRIHKADEESEKHFDGSQEWQASYSHAEVNEFRYQLNYHKLNKKIFLPLRRKARIKVE